MDRQEPLLDALAAEGAYVPFSPAQAQKLLFLIDREASELTDGPHFNFEPHDYGPIDKEVYDELDDLAENDRVEMQRVGRFRQYVLTPAGHEKGCEEPSKLPESGSTFVRQAAEWVRSVTFQQLIAGIYNQYPEMRVKSIFRE